MQFAFVSIVALAASFVCAQSPAGSPPAGCSTTYSSSFEISVYLPMKKRDIVERAACATSGTLVATLTNGVLTDAQGRIGGIVANRQFQFDGPPSQAGTIYNSGFSVCGNGSLALGPSAIFYQCLSGTFYNIYDEPSGASCEAIVIAVIPCGGVAQGADGQPTAASAVSQQPDGQPTAASASAQPVSQFTDGQIQVTGNPPKVTQISDGQIQATSATPPKVTQISDGQIQASASATQPEVTQISDGQIQASASAASATQPKVTQISDGQIQASASSPANVSKPLVTGNATQAGSSPTPTSPTKVSVALAAPIVTAGAQAVVAIAGFVALAML